VRPRFSSLYTLKTKIFLGKNKLGRSALSYAKNYSGRRYAPPLAGSASKPNGRAWCGHARPIKKPRKFSKRGDLDCLFILFWYNMYAKE
jgi:hypothetical protein